MKQHLENRDLIFKESENVASRFEAFRAIVVDYGLSAFVTFVMHKNFEHTELELLDDEAKLVLMEECAPLIREAIDHGISVQ